MKIFLDDERMPVDTTWTIVRDIDEFITTVSRNIENITEFSLDHDLGESEAGIPKPTGYDCIKWLINDFLLNDPEYAEKLNKITIHSQNPTGVMNMYTFLNNAQKHGILSPNVTIRK